MQRNLFLSQKMTQGNKKWEYSITRKGGLYSRSDDIRSDFIRDYNRLLHSTAFRRLKHKTQVFPAPNNDHICTRMEHANLVASVSYNIAKFLGLNTELTKAIAIGHDLGHPPFGHEGQNILNEISNSFLQEQFWHEKNSLRFVDFIETLENPDNIHMNLNLTYAVRDGIICHCGEIDENGIKLRELNIDLTKINEPGKIQPYTWEGCVVKISDKIAFLGRDIEDAIALKILDRRQLRPLRSLIRKYGPTKIKEINNTIVIHELIIDLCKNSDPGNGLKLSDKFFEIMNSIKSFNNKYIYNHERLKTYAAYARIVMQSIFNFLKQFYSQEKTINKLLLNVDRFPILIKTFLEWTIKYFKGYEEIDLISGIYMRDIKNWKNIYKNKKIYNIKNEEDYLRSIIDFLAGMTDNFAIRVFQELTTF
jgi:dGTPase